MLNFKPQEIHALMFKEADRLASLAVPDRAAKVLENDLMIMIGHLPD